jgi:bzd-type benzoyl-CoA reductase N subunit
MTLFDIFHQVAADPVAYARQWKEESGRPVIGTLCSYAPEEIIWAAGALPFRLLGTSEDLSRADAHLQSYCCSMARGVLGCALSGRYDFLDGAVFPHTCDAIQRLSDIWRLNTNFFFHADVVLPVKLDTASSEAYLEAVLRRFRNEISEALGQPVGNPELRRAADLFDRCRRALRRLYDFRRRHPGRICGAEMHAVQRAASVMDRGRLVEVVETLLEALDRFPDPETPDTRKRLLLAGGPCDLPELYAAIEAAGAVVVQDDLCTGARYAEGSVSDAADPIQAIAERYRSRAVCPAKHRGLQARSEHIVDLVRTAAADGVVFPLLKFCDPHFFDHPHLKVVLDEQAIPSLLLEIDAPGISTEAIQTRIEAFVERL